VEFLDTNVTAQEHTMVIGDGSGAPNAGMKYPKRAASKVTPSIRLIFTIMVDGYPDDDADEKQRCVIAYVKASMTLNKCPDVLLFEDYSVV